MTRNRDSFSRKPDRDHLALIEGRMVHQHRFSAKAYRSGTGRRARWDTVPFGAQELKPQFWYPASKLPPHVRDRTQQPRVGFCDITGQTNERSMLAALIPPGVVCGNKVPTVTFAADQGDNRLLLWLAIVNSIPFDWALRRIVTTTVNYFLLNSVPLPRPQPDTLPGRRIVEAARELHCSDSGKVPVNPLRVAELRAAIDVGVHVAYGLGFSELELMLNAFPLLDRGQPVLEGEERSTITRDFLLVRAAKRLRTGAGGYEERLAAAEELGAVPYIPSEFVPRGVEDTVEANDA